MTLKPILNCGVDFGKPLHIIVDSTGLSIHGEGPWSRHKHGKKRRRGWRKLHIIIDSQGIIHTAIISTGHTRDASRVPPLLKDIKAPISSFIGDKGYDQGSVYRAVLKNNKEANIVIHPRMNAVLLSNIERTQRDKHSRYLLKILEDGIYSWRRESGYYQQSRVENTFYRYKTIIGRKQRARKEEARKVEAIIGCKILNRFLVMSRENSELEV